MNDNAQQLLDSLLAYQFAPAIGKQWSHVALFKEYARRMAWWADKIGPGDNWLTANIPYVLELDDGLDPSPLQKLDTHLQTQQLYQPMPALIQAGLMYAMLQDNPQLADYELESPYEALIKLYTRGGHIRWNQRGFWEVSGSFGVGGIDISTYKRTQPFVALDDEELDLIDKGDSNDNMPKL